MQWSEIGKRIHFAQDFVGNERGCGEALAAMDRAVTDCHNRAQPALLLKNAEEFLQGNVVAAAVERHFGLLALFLDNKPAFRLSEVFCQSRKKRLAVGTREDAEFNGRTAAVHNENERANIDHIGIPCHLCNWERFPDACVS
ncbi:hypothetical protein D3C87_1586660 [compost metagenome]